MGDAFGHHLAVYSGKAQHLDLFRPGYRIAEGNIHRRVCFKTLCQVAACSTLQFTGINDGSLLGAQPGNERIILLALDLHLVEILVVGDHCEVDLRPVPGNGYGVLLKPQGTEYQSYIPGIVAFDPEFAFGIGEGSFCGAEPENIYAGQPGLVAGSALFGNGSAHRLGPAGKV